MRQAPRRRPPPWRLMRPCRKPSGWPSRRISPGSTPMKAAPAEIRRQDHRGGQDIPEPQQRQADRHPHRARARSARDRGEVARGQCRLARHRGYRDRRPPRRAEKLAPRAAATRLGSRFSSAQGQIRIETFRLAEGSLPALFEEEKKASKREVHVSTLEPQSFIISGVQGLEELCRSRRGERQRIARRHGALRSGHRRHHGPGRGGDRRHVRGIS